MKIVGENYCYEFCVLCGTVSTFDVQFCDRKERPLSPLLLIGPKNSGGLRLNLERDESVGHFVHVVSIFRRFSWRVTYASPVFCRHPLLTHDFTSVQVMAT